MSNEQMDALFRKVFNDVEIGDEQLLTSANGDAALNQEEVVLMNLKSELRGLSEVPECQLSTERLRDAILSRGAMPDKVSPFKNWWKFAVPVAACAAMGAFLISNPGATSRTVEPSSGPIARTGATTPPKTLETVPNVANETVDQIADQTLQETTAPVTSTEPTVTHSSPVAKRSSSNGQRLASRTGDAHPTTLEGGNPSAMMQLASSPAGSSAVSKLASGAVEGFTNRNKRDAGTTGPAFDANKPAESTVVIVAAGTDPQTRASSATEVDKKNVVFGG